MELVLDTNIFVAASFNPNSASGRIVKSIGEKQHDLVWNKATKRETKRILKKIPPVSWSQFENLFLEKSEYEGKVDVGGLDFIKDKEDIKFAALARTTGAVLVTNDDHLLSVRSRFDFSCMTSGEFQRRTCEF